MHLYWLLCTIFCIFALECHGQQFNSKEEPVKNCGAKFSRQVDVRGSRAQRRDGEIIIADFKRDSFSCAEKPGTLIKHANVRIDLQDPSGGFERNGKRWRNLQVQLNGPRPNGFPSTVATVLLQCDKTFPIRLVRKAFVDSMTKCAMIWLSQ
ncbi:uncharacterized protein LOC130695961 [Daphnia carinata]|uniref:uncharacterized protein LOC130695961 n=1 Tax=Daphnia carinata TaxID=120202 RepID=UPI00257C1E47|nr:uncharacterized protein LOC130695961 [Daphnia carinata]